MGAWNCSSSCCDDFLNEEHNLEEVFENLKGWAQEVFLVDSYSKDKTIDIALKHGVNVVQRSLKTLEINGILH